MNVSWSNRTDSQEERIVDHRSAAQYNVEIHRPKGLGGWRSLYLQFIRHMDIVSLIEVGAGAPAFLKAVQCPNKTAVDAGRRWADEFRESKIDFIKLDLDNDSLPRIGPFDVAVCSDVFEHLLYPDRTLAFLHSILSDDGFLFSHVPNEFALRKTIRVMVGRSESLYSHQHCEEFNDPHLHRFTKIGFGKFLRREFHYNLFIGDLKYRKIQRLLRKLRLPVPYALEYGPTFVSTNSRGRFDMLKAVKERISQKRHSALFRSLSASQTSNKTDREVHPFPLMGRRIKRPMRP